MFLVEAPLGRAHTITADGWQASSLTAPPAGFDSVVARGRYGPQPSWPSWPGGGGGGSSASSSSSSSSSASGGGDDFVNLQIDGRPVRVPQGKMGPTDCCSHSSFAHNEILVYKESQHRIRYVLLIDW
jgi:poly [ADP-ribose] polymerase